MAETIRDVLIRIRLDQEPAKLEVPDIQPATSAFEEYTETVETAFEETTEYFEDVEDALEDVNAQVEMSQREINDLGITAADGLRTATEGVLTFARGWTFLSIEQEEALAEVVEQLAAIQGGIDIMKGSIDTVKGVRDAYLAISDAGGIAVITQNALAGANTAVTATFTAASGAAKAFWASLGPIGIAIVGLTTAATALGAAWYFFSDGEAAEGVEETTEKIEEMKSSVDDLNVILDETRQKLQAFQTASNLQDQIESLNEQRDALDGIVDLNEKLERLEERRATENERIRDTFSIMLAGGQFGFDEIARDMEAAGLQFENILEMLDLVADGAIAEDVTLQSAAAETLVAAMEARLSSEQDILRVLERQSQESEKQLESAKDAFQTTKDQIAAEQQRLQSLDEIIGRLDAVDRAEVEKLVNKAGGEGLSSEELRRLEQLGGSAVSDFVSGQFAEKGKAAGGAEIFEPILGEQRGAGSQLDQLRQQRDELLQELRGETGLGAAAGEQEILEAMREQLREQRSAQADQIDAMQAIVEQLSEYRQQLSQLKLQIDEQENQP